MPSQSEPLRLAPSESDPFNKLFRVVDTSSRTFCVSARGPAPPLRAGMLRELAPGYRAVVGLTGSIASGKSHAREHLARLGAVTIDADRLGHAAYRRGTACYDAVVREFGAEIVGADGACTRTDAVAACER